MSRRSAEAIARRYQAGESLGDLSRDLRRPASVISQTLGALGVRLKVNQPRRLLSREDLVELYVRRGLSSQAVGLALGVSSQKVRDDLRYHGIALRPRRPRPAGVASVRAETLRRLYLKEGLSLEQIAGRLGCSRPAVTAAVDRLGIARQPGNRIREDQAAVRSALVELYQDQGLSIAGVARVMGRSPEYVSDRLRRYGIARRPPPPGPGVDAELLRRAWVVDRRSLEDIAGELGISRARLRAELSRQDISRPRRSPRLAAVSRQSLEELYLGQELSASEVARKLGCSPNWICDELRRFGIPVRPRNWRPGQPAEGLTREILADLYLDQHLSVEEVAARLGCASSSVYNALHRFKVPIRRPETVPVSLSAEEMRSLYVEQRLSEDEIGARLGTSAWQVRVRRRTLGVRRPASPPPHPPPVTSPGREVLQELYVVQGLTLVEIARQYHTSGPKVRAWLVEAGIPVAPRTTRATRIDLPAEALEVLYVEMGMSMREVAAELDVRPAKVRRALHDHGIPVRPTRRRGVPAVRLLEQLYSDPQVAGWLVDHRLPARPEPGTLSERFPQPVLLTHELLADSYVRIGLSAQHIEMLTGQSMEQVLDALVASGIPVRTEQGMSPWRRRLLDSLRDGERRDRAS